MMIPATTTHFMFRNLSILLALVGIVAAVFLVQRLRHVEPPAPPLVEPARAPFPESIGARGIIESVNENVRIAPSLAGLITRVAVKVGDVVKPGDVLIEQDSREASALVAIQETQIETLRAQLREAEVLLADKRDQWGRMEKLTETRVSSVEERQRVKFAEAAAKDFGVGESRVVPFDRARAKADVSVEGNAKKKAKGKKAKDTESTEVAD